MDAEKLIGRKWRLLTATMDERARRLWAGAEADALGWGGIASCRPRCSRYGIRVGDKAGFRGDWNYIVRSRTQEC